MWFAETPVELERAKALCADCPIRRECLAAALERGGAVGRLGWRDSRPRHRHRAQASAWPPAQEHRGQPGSCVSAAGLSRAQVGSGRFVGEAWDQLCGEPFGRNVRIELA